MKLGNKAEIQFVSFAILVSFVISVFWGMVFDPAIITHDGWMMWNQAISNSYMTWFPPIMPMLMHITLYLPKSVAYFSFLQRFLYTLSLLVLLRETITNNRLFISAAIVLLFALPSLWVFQLMLFSNVWLVTFAMFTVTLLLKGLKSHFQRNILLASLCLSVAISFRHEAVFYVIIPIIALQFFYRSYLSKKQLGMRLLSTILIVFISIAPSRFIEKLPIVEVHNKPIPIHINSQYFGTLHYAQKKGAMTATDIDTERQSFDQQFGDGMFDLLLSIYRCNLLATRPKQRTPSMQSFWENQSFIIEKVASTALKYPASFVQHRLCNLSALMQIPEIKHYAIPPEYWRNNSRPKMVSEEAFRRLDASPKNHLPGVYEWVARTMLVTLESPLLNWIYRHYIFIGLAALLLIASGYLKSWAIAIPAMFSLFGLTAYLIIDNFPEWRYLLPSYLFSWIAIFAFLDHVVSKLANTKSM